MIFVKNLVRIVLWKGNAGNRFVMPVERENPVYKRKVQYHMIIKAPFISNVKKSP